LGATLELRRPHGDLSIQTIESAANQPFLLRFKDSGVRLRGQFLAVEDGLWLFLGSPWFDTAAEIEAAGLSLIDYPIHDPMAELLMIGQTQRMALSDLNEVNERLEQQREAVKRTERIYRDAIAAADAVVYHENVGGDRYDFIDAGIERLTGVGVDEMTPKRLQGMVVESREIDATIDAADANDPQSARKRDFRIRNHEGSERWLSEASIQVSNEDSEATGRVGILEDITERKDKEAALERLGFELDTILKLSPQGFAAFDAQGRLSYCNPSFEEMTGAKRAHLEGLHVSLLDQMFSKLADQEKSVTPLQELAENQLDEIELTHPHRRNLTRSMRQMRSAEHELRGWVLFMRDVTRERQIDRMKSEFLSTAAHELRTPMTSVRGFAELLMSNDYDRNMTREIAETIHRQSELLVHIVNELLDIARIEAGQSADLVFERHAIHELVEQTVSSLHLPGDKHTIRLALGCGNSPMVLADAKKTIQALTNVLSNAIKYSPDGGAIDVSVFRRRKDRRNEVGIAITDRGIGMDKSEVGRLFERFYRADPSGAIPGTGLGMSLVQDIVDLHDGSIEIDSTKGFGTTVSVFLPEADQDTQRADGRPTSTNTEDKARAVETCNDVLH
jgi:PAS domain S-box-containing protein